MLPLCLGKPFERSRSNGGSGIALLAVRLRAHRRVDRRAIARVAVAS